MLGRKKLRTGKKKAEEKKRLIMAVQKVGDEEERSGRK